MNGGVTNDFFLGLQGIGKPKKTVEETTKKGLAQNGRNTNLDFDKTYWAVSLITICHNMDHMTHLEPKQLIGRGQAKDK